MKKTFKFGIGILFLISLVISASSQPSLETANAEWKVPVSDSFKDVNQEEYKQFIENTYSKDITTTNINYIAKKQMYNFSLLKKDGTPFYRIKFSAVNDTAEDIQKKAEYWANYWMIFEYRKSETKEDIIGLNFSSGVTQTLAGDSN